MTADLSGVSLWSMFSRSFWRMFSPSCTTSPHLCTVWYVLLEQIIPTCQFLSSRRPLASEVLLWFLFITGTELSWFRLDWPQRWMRFLGPKCLYCSWVTEPNTRITNCNAITCDVEEVSVGLLLVFSGLKQHKKVLWNGFMVNQAQVLTEYDHAAWCFHTTSLKICDSTQLILYKPVSASSSIPTLFATNLRCIQNGALETKGSLSQCQNVSEIRLLRVK